MLKTDTGQQAFVDALLFTRPKGMTRREYQDALYFMQEEVGRFQWPDFDEITRGAIIGTVEIVDCVSESSSPWFMGDYGFMLKNAIALPEPVECKGALGFWDVPEDIACRL